jgi:hypothetical protein
VAVTCAGVPPLNTDAREPERGLECTPLVMEDLVLALVCDPLTTEEREYIPALYGRPGGPVDPGDPRGLATLKACTPLSTELRRPVPVLQCTPLAADARGLENMSCSGRGM